MIVLGKTDDHGFLLNAPEFLPLDLEELKKFHSSNPEGFNAMMCAYMEYFENQLTSDVDAFLKSSKQFLQKFSSYTGQRLSRREPQLCY